MFLGSGAMDKEDVPEGTRASNHAQLICNDAIPEDGGRFGASAFLSRCKEKWQAGCWGWAKQRKPPKGPLARETNAGC